MPNKSFSQCIDDLYPQAKRLKEGKDEQFKKETNQFKAIPSL